MVNGVDGTLDWVYWDIIYYMLNIFSVVYARNYCEISLYMKS
jgi:hypothetical protein